MFENSFTVNEPIKSVILALKETVFKITFLLWGRRKARHSETFPVALNKDFLFTNF